MLLNSETPITLRRQNARTNLLIENEQLSIVENERIGELLSFPSDLSVSTTTSTESLEVTERALTNVARLQKDRTINSGKTI